MFVEEKAKGELDATAQLLLKAADLIERDGWGEGDCIEHGYCIYAALVKADDPKAFNTARASAAGWRLVKALGLHRISDLFHWNDAPERTAAEVIAKLRAVALSG